MFAIRSREGDIGEPVYTLGFLGKNCYGDGSISASTVMIKIKCISGFCACESRE